VVWDHEVAGSIPVTPTKNIIIYTCYNLRNDP